MRINTFAVRVFAVVCGGAGLVAGFALGGGDAHAGTECNAANGSSVQHISGTSGCGARAGAGSSASATDASSSGTAVAVADGGGHARAHNLQPGSTALAGANSGGNAYSVTTGPGAMSIAQARRGSNSVAVGGWGGQAVATEQGVSCSGGFAAAADSGSGKACLRSGSISLRY